MVGGGVGPKHANIVLGRSHNSYDALNWTNNQKKISFFLLFWPYEGVVGVRVVQKGQKHVTIVLGRSHISSHACNLIKKMFLIFFILVQFGAETTVNHGMMEKILLWRNLKLVHRIKQKNRFMGYKITIFTS